MDQLTKVISMRISESDDALLTRVSSKIRVAKRLAVAREAMRRGLEAMDAEQETQTKKRGGR